MPFPSFKQSTQDGFPQYQWYLTTALQRGPPQQAIRVKPFPREPNFEGQCQAALQPSLPHCPPKLKGQLTHAMQCKGRELLRCSKLREQRKHPSNGQLSILGGQFQVYLPLRRQLLRFRSDFFCRRPRIPFSAVRSTCGQTIVWSVVSGRELII